jgi:RNA polymerase sigma factor (sigma-70 family)
VLALRPKSSGSKRSPAVPVPEGGSEQAELTHLAQRFSPLVSLRDMSSPPCTVDASIIELPLADTPASDATLPDAALVRQSLAGDEEAFRLLYRRHSPRLRGLIRRLIGRAGGDSDDVLQVVWLRAMRGAAAFRWTSSLSSWLCGIAVRASMETLRDGRRRTVFALDSDVEAPAPDIVSRLDLENAMARLPEHHRIVLLLHDVEGFTHEEIASQLGIAVGTSKANLHHARRLMRAMLTSSSEGPPT